ncbi:hypothetical protein PVAND_006547 [Polypedilum vanderplanki]|uniref:Derlin n=1 Tax=Polypedilum vanderplanki TaxID=319348 RepID=A0A9J6C403_POLVA|nr:hypothetical protein PVAND_006547 [Polypedilum vanderplanki]
MSDFSSWYNSIPRFTRYYLTATVGLSVAEKIGLVSRYALLLNWPLVISHFNIWRPITALFYYPTSFHFLMNCFFMYNYSSRLEKEHYLGSPSDFVYMLLFNWICCLGVSLFVPLPVLMDPMVLSVLYIWCQLNKEIIVTFWFGSRFKAMYLPWVLFAFNVLLSNGGMLSLFGILIGHLYFFLKFTYPLELNGSDFLKTPQFIKNYLPDVRPSGVFGFAPEGRTTQHNEPQRRTGTLFGGAGHRLGNN